MSLPITAVGPLNVLTNPILMVSAAIAEFANARDVTPASQNAALIVIFLLVIAYKGSRRPAPVGAALGAVPRRLSSRCPVLCAKRPVSGKHEPAAPPRTFGALHPQMHHNSPPSPMARIIVLVGSSSTPSYLCGTSGGLSETRAPVQR